MIRHLLSLSFVVLTVATSALAADDEGKWVSLFNGKDMEGWIPKIRGYESGDNHANTFRVEDGLLKVRYDGYKKFDSKFGHLFYKEQYSHYKFRVEYRFVGEQTEGGPGWAFRNSGIMVHGQTAESMSKDQDFPVSIEVQLLGGSGQGKRSTANLCTPGTNVVMKGKLFTPHCTSSRSKTYHGDQWVTALVEVRGNDVIKHVINGEQVLSYSQPQLDDRDANAKKLIEKNGTKMLSKGTISLQSESHSCDFRKIEIMILKE